MFMTDIVLVALIGVAGTLAGGVIGPLAKDRLDRRARRRDESRKEIGEILAKVDSLLMKMLRLSHDAPERQWHTVREEAVALIARLSYLLNEGEGEIANVLGHATVIASADGTKATSTANHWSVVIATTHVAAWYRGERSTDGIQQQVLDMWQFMYDGVVSGSMQPNGEVVDPSELNESEMQRRVEIEAQGGVKMPPPPTKRRSWLRRR